MASKIKSRNKFLVFLVLVSILQASCGSERTYHKDIAPIMTENCVSCHRSGNIAPFRLDTYSEVKSWARASLVSMQNRTMPPWTVNNSGECQSFEGTTWMKDKDIAVFADWIENEMPEGDKEDAPEAYKPPARLDGFTHVLKTPAYTPHQFYHPDDQAKERIKHDGETHTNLPTDDYRCFIVDPELTEDKYLTAFEVSSSRPEMAHHMILYLLSGAALEAAEALVPEGETGYECFGGPGIDLVSSEGGLQDGVRMLAGWAPGTPPTRYPEGTGVRIPAGYVPVIQMHYNTENGIGEDVTDIKMVLTDSIDKEAYIIPMADLDMTIPPGQKLASTTFDIPLGEFFLGDTGFSTLPGGVELYGVYPHMHKRGVNLQFEETTPGSKQCLTRVDTWDFDWQRFYFYKQPLELDVTIESSFRLSCGYNTSDDTEPVLWGDGTEDEMCLNFLYMHIPICQTLGDECGF
jgi:hypothetical protein